MATARTVVTQALKEIGVLAAGETPSAEDAADSFAALNRLVDQMAAQRLFIYTVTRTEFTITSGDGTYTLGPTGDVVIPRPVSPDGITVNYQDTSTDPDSEFPLGKPISEEAWAALRFKDQTGNIPQLVYYNPTYPNGTLIFWPAPTSTTLQGVIYVPTQLSQFTNLTTAVSLPPGYEEFLITNLALRLAPSYGRNLDASLVLRAQEATAIVKRSNNRLVDLKFDPGALIGANQRSYDILQG